MQFVFDQPHTKAINEARLNHLASIDLKLENSTVLEVGAGIGLLTGFFEKLGCTILSTEARETSIEEHSRRYPHRSVEFADLSKSGSHDRFGEFDIVFCYGTLYHLSNPALAIKDLSKACRSLLLLETCVYPIDNGSSNSIKKPESALDQSFEGIGCRPARNWVLSQLRKHFPYAYVTASQPDHPDFPLNWPVLQKSSLTRSVFVASKTPLDIPILLQDLPSNQYVSASLQSSIKFEPQPPLKKTEGILFDNFRVSLDPCSTEVGGSWQGIRRAGMPTAWDMKTIKFFYERTLDIENPVILDVGANTGSFCLLARINQSIKCLAFEPMPMIYEILKNNILLNKLQYNVKALQIALSNKKGSEVLKYPKSGTDSGFACLGKPIRFDNWTEMEVSVNTLDQIAIEEGIKKVDLIKIDTEGCELFVLKGGENLIREYHPGILTEYYEANTQQFGYNAERIRDLLSSWGYDSKKISSEDMYFYKPKAKKFPLMDPKTSISGAITNGEKDHHEWITKVATDQNRLYYRDQTPEALNDLVKLVDQYKPTKIVELGTLSGLSLRTWLSTDTDAEIIAIDLSFDALRQSQQIIQVDLSKVKLLEQDILQIDFSQLWGPDDRVLLYVDAHDMPNVPIMDHVLQNAVPALPHGSVVVVDDMWHSLSTLSQKTARQFFENTVINEIDPLQCFQGYYAPYWKMGSFFGFREVIPLMEWVNKNQIDLVFKRGIKSVAFEWKKKAGDNPLFDSKEFERLCGDVKYNPVEILHNRGKDYTQGDQQIDEIYKQGTELYAKGRMDLALVCFQRTSDLSPSMTGAYYAQGVILARSGKFKEALLILEKETLNFSPHPNALSMIEDIRSMMNKRRNSKQELLKKEKTQAITIFTMPKSFKGHIDIIQRNAIKSWTLLQPRPEIILLGDDEGTAETAKEFGLRHIPHVERNELGTPFLNSIFEIGQREASHSVMAYVNADIILADDFTTAIGRVINQGFDSFLMVGQRWDINITEPIPFKKATWDKELRQSVEQIGTLHSPTGLDYFIFKDNPWGNILPFLIGRTSWDGWLLFKALSSDVPVIDATESIFAAHQDHNYNHAKGGYAGAWSGPEAEYNQKLARRYNSVRSIVDASWSLINDDLCQSAYAFPDLSDNQKTPHEFAARLCQQGKFFLKKGNFLRALSCLKEAGRNDKSVPGLTEAMLSARKKIEALESVKDVKEKQVSVVIPTCNRAGLITRAIRSVQVQTHSVTEIIIIDDASTDNTESVIKEIVANDPRVVYLRHDKTKGAQAARKTGIRHANAEWIAFLDSDDEWLPEKLEKQFAAVNSNHSSIAHCECYVQRGNGTERALFGVPPYSGNIYEMVLKHPGPMFQGLLVQKKHLEAIGLLDENVPSYQEWDTSIRLAKHYTFAFIPEPLFVYYLHSGDTISKDNRREVDGWAYIVEKHKSEINRVAGGNVLANHYEILARKNYALLDFPKGGLYAAKGVGINQLKNDHIVSHIQKKRALLLFQAGNQFLKDKNYSFALRAFDEVMYTYPKFKNLQYARSVCLEKVNRMEEAYDAAKAELKITKNHHESIEILNCLNYTNGVNNYSTQPMNDKPLRKSNVNFTKTNNKRAQIDESKVFLVSYPRSGNTLIRTYLYNILGSEYYSVYEGDGVLFDSKSYIPDWQNIKIIKDHTFRREYHNVIYLIRDGRDALLSLAYYIFLHKQHHLKKREELQNFIQFTKERYPYGFWGDYVKNALELARVTNIHFVKYEDLIEDPLNQLLSILDFLGQKVDSDSLENAIKKSLEDKRYQKWWDWGFTYNPDKNSFFYTLSKNRGKSNWKKIFDDRAKAIFHEYGGTEMLLEFGYETDENWWRE